MPKNWHKILMGIPLVSLVCSDFKRNVGEHRILEMEMITQVTKSSFYSCKKTSHTVPSLISTLINQAGLLQHFFLYDLSKVALLT